MSGYLHWTLSGWDAIWLVVCLALVPIFIAYDRWHGERD